MSDKIYQYEPLWGSWYIDALIGEGSFGRVYRVKREEFGRTYYSAVKIITIPQGEHDLRQMKSEGMDDASVKSYFYAFVADIIQEIDVMREFRGNSNIVSFEDHKVIESSDGLGWDILIRMELLTSLSDYVTEKPLTQEDVIKLGIHICRALELCEIKNTIHRDIKPDNIFVSQYGDFKLGDFGIARQIERTMSGLSKKGTYTYMAPEVFRGYAYSNTVDIYSLGIVMYRFLNKNRTPFLPEYPQPIMPNDRDDALQRRMNGEPLPEIPGVSAEFNAVLSKACAFDRKERYASASEMLEELKKLIGVSCKLAEHVPFVRQISKKARTEQNPHEKNTLLLERTEVNGIGVVYKPKFADELQTQSDDKEDDVDDLYNTESTELRKQNRNISLAKIALLIVSLVFLVVLTVTLFTRSVPPNEIVIAGRVIKTDITELDLSDCAISDLTQIESLTSLTTLNLSRTEISDITPLQKLINLEVLYLSGNNIRNISLKWNDCFRFVELSSGDLVFAKESQIC